MEEVATPVLPSGTATEGQALTGSDKGADTDTESKTTVDDEETARMKDRERKRKERGAAKRSFQTFLSFTGQDGSWPLHLTVSVHAVVVQRLVLAQDAPSLGFGDLVIVTGLQNEFTPEKIGIRVNTVGVTTPQVCPVELATSLHPVLLLEPHVLEVFFHLDLSGSVH